ncbi:MAG TPA: endolytic transglycosylase MltG [Solirubrobacterales bacterium]|nr:endolytic transglycosylase MltG [Solirubrobacterales bacterium]
MSDEWLGDPFAEDDPAAVAREKRRREREERRRQREAARSPSDPPQAPPEPRAPAVPPASEPPSPAEPPDSPEPPPSEPPPPPPRPDPWDDEGPLPPAPPYRPATSRRGRRVLVTLALGLLLLGAAAAYAAYRYLDRDDPPPAPAAAPRTMTLTVPEGLSRAQTAELAEEAGLRGDYMAATVSSPYLKPARYGGGSAKDLEGFLFPDTFELRRRAPVTDLVQLQLEDFERRIAGVDMSYARSKNLTTYDVLIIASMVEEEAQLESERPLIAAVIYNRLSDGMPLGIDATIRFATGNYTAPLTESELATDSPYNTRLKTGLPPGPIGNPGLASIEAAARPANVDYLFYVVKPGACGEHSFSSTEEEFFADSARYDEAREAAGGESPDTCPE